MSGFLRPRSTNKEICRQRQTEAEVKTGNCLEKLDKQRYGKSKRRSKARTYESLEKVLTKAPLMGVLKI